MADVRALVDEATFEFTMGDHAKALQLIEQALAQDPACFDAWLAKAEVHFDQRQLDDALAAAQEALKLDPDQAHIHTTLSRIYMERGDKQQAEHHGAQARIKGWKAELSGQRDDDE
ncbi:MAG: tetratricopeptide repeat protein [Verrucomicrobiota bacterium JB022]|nr:tetratricopeptide repeat protein [Verrucomicrobiota bacterium JB022]